MSDSDSVIPNRTVRVVLAPHVDWAIVTMGMAQWDMIVRMVKLAAQCSPRTDMQAMLAQVVAADNVARQSWAATTGSDPQ